MFSNVICRVVFVGAFSAGVVWAMVLPSLAPSQAEASEYAYNDREREAVAEARNLEVERLLSPLVLPEAEAYEPSETSVVPKVRIRDPFYDFEAALVGSAEINRVVEVEKIASGEENAMPTRAVKRPTGKPIGSSKSTVSAAWRKLANIRQSVLLAEDDGRTTTSRQAAGRRMFLSSRWSGATREE